MLSWVQYSPAGRCGNEENGFRIEKGENPGSHVDDGRETAIACKKKNITFRNI